MVGLVICQLFETNVRSSPRFGSLWSQAKQISVFWASVGESYRALTAVSAALVLVGAAAAFGVAKSGAPPAARAAAEVRMNCRRLTAGAGVSQPGQRVSWGPS